MHFVESGNPYKSETELGDDVIDVVASDKNGQPGEKCVSRYRSENMKVMILKLSAPTPRYLRARVAEYPDGQVSFVLSMNQFLHLRKSEIKGEIWDASPKWKTYKYNVTILKYRTWEQATLQLHLPEKSEWKIMNRINIARYPMQIDPITCKMCLDVLQLSDTPKRQPVHINDVPITPPTKKYGQIQKALQDLRLAPAAQKAMINRPWADATDDECDAGM